MRLAAAPSCDVFESVSHRRRDGTVVPRRDEGQPPQNGGDEDNVDDGPNLGLNPADAASSFSSLPPPATRGGVPAGGQMLSFTLNLYCVCRKNKMFLDCSRVVCILFAQRY